jgi:hypothetical protein
VSIQRRALGKEGTHVLNALLLDAGVLENGLDGFERVPEEAYVDLLELGAGKGLREVPSLTSRSSLPKTLEVGQNVSLLRVKLGK